MDNGTTWDSEPVQDSDDNAAQRDEVLRRMLNTPKTPSKSGVPNDANRQPDSPDPGVSHMKFRRRART